MRYEGVSMHSLILLLHSFFSWVLVGMVYLLLEVLMVFSHHPRPSASTALPIAPLLTYLDFSFTSSSEDDRPITLCKGRVRYKFASFWNRNNAVRALQRAAKNFHSMLEAEKKESAESALRAHSSSVRGSKRQAKIPEDCASKTEKLQPFIKEEDVFPCTAEQFFNILLIDDSSYTNESRSLRKDTNLNIGQWHAADEYDGQVRELKFRSLCNSPMCPPDTAMTEWQHAVLSPDKKMLVFETVQQAHDVPFGSYFEVHCRWCLEMNAENSSTIDIKVGAHFKKWCVMQSKIKTGAINEYKKEVELMLEVACSYIKSHSSGDANKPSPSPSLSITQESS